MALHLCYAYIKDYNNGQLADIGISIDPHYTYSFDKENRKLQIDECTKLPDDFWGDKIYSITAVFGNNGVGKSSFICFLIRSLIEGNNGDLIKGLIVYKDDSGFRVYSTLTGADSISVLYKKNAIEPKDRLAMKVFYYSGHFQMDTDDIRCQNLDGLYNATDSACLIKYYEDETWKVSGNLTRPYYSYLNAYYSQNTYRISKMLCDKQLRNIIREYAMPKYLLIKPNKSGCHFLEEKEERKFLDLIKDEYDKEECLNSFIYYNFLNLIYEKKEVNYREVLDKWKAYQSACENTLSKFLSFINSDGIANTEKSDLKSIYNALLFVSSECHYDGENGVFYLEFKSDESKLGTVTENLNGELFHVCRYYDLQFSHTLVQKRVITVPQSKLDSEENKTILSSGEQKLLDLLSRLYDAISNHNSQLIFLDEAEIGFHPMWQIKYVKLLLDFLGAKLRDEVQIVLTSHSPFLISDFPSCCCNCLQKKDSGVVNVKLKNETFAANVFSLYRNSFLLEDGLIGSFAQGKIGKIIQDIENKTKDKDKIKREIELVGDEYVKEYLLERYVELLEDREKLDYYNAKIEEINNRMEKATTKD